MIIERAIGVVYLAKILTLPWVFFLLPPAVVIQAASKPRNDLVHTIPRHTYVWRTFVNELPFAVKLIIDR